MYVLAHRNPMQALHTIAVAPGLRFVVAALGALCLSASCPSDAFAEEQAMAEDGRTNTHAISHHNAKPRLRGDYEPNDLLLLVWQPEWEKTVKQVALAAAKEMRVQVLIPRGVWTASRAFRHWAKSQCVDIAFHQYDTAWIRDYGPVQVVEGDHVTWRDFGYDSERPKDDSFPNTLASAYRVPMQFGRGRLDGGGLVSNGQGLCVMTTSTVEELEIPKDDVTGMIQFLDELGCRVLATIDALPEEQTGHADVSVQFLGHNLVAVASMDPEEAPVQAAMLDAAVHSIQRASRRLGMELKVLRVPMVHRGEIFYSYVNAVRTGSSLLVPSYHDVPKDVQALAYNAFGAALPDLRIVPIVADEVVEFGGALHCITLGLKLPQEDTKKPTCSSVKFARQSEQHKASAHKASRRM